MSNINKQALREIAAAAVGAHERLSVMPPDDIFDISLAEGTQLDADITALNALNSAANPTTVLALLDELEKMQAQSSKWCEAFHKAVSVGARYEERIAELEAKLDSADKLQDSAFRHGLQHGFSLGQTDNQAGFEECLSAYGTGKGE
ncbi:ead/Ea22-like family protein [Escherichia coli]|uniref:ead/Ea22-like family protein n=2 Tax=Escherichia coli TaxID=562 RepID=UPI00351D22F7